MSDVKCAHCLTGFPERNALYYEAEGERKAFCCNGCLGVYRIINNEGLGEFYKKPDRSKTSILPPEKSIPHEVGAFENNVRLIDGPVREVDLYIDHIRCASCVWLNEKALSKLNGVIGARVNYSTHKAVVRWDANLIGLKEILERIIAIGYRPRPYSEDEAFKAQSEQKRDFLIRFGTAAFLSSQLTLYSVALYAGYFQGMEAGQKIFLQVIAMGIATPVVFYCGFPFIRAALGGLRRFYFNMDSLIAVGSLSAYLYSVCQIFNGGDVYFDTASMIITIILLGRYIELSAKTGASQAIRRLAELLPNEARIIKITDVKTGDDLKISDGLKVSDRVYTAVEAVLAGQLVEVLPGQRIPLDGKVVDGATFEVDESIITGESKPVSKGVGATVIGGTLNLGSPFVFRVTNVGKDTVVAKIIKAVGDAQAVKPRIQTLADRLVGHFVKAVLLIAVATLWYHLIWSGESMEQALMAGISVVVIACPCSLGLATPLAVLVFTVAMSRAGILIKSGGVIEKAAKVRSVFFDKTGTLTAGKMVLSRVCIINKRPGKDYDAENTVENAVKLAASLERFSEHSIGKAIVGSFGVSGFLPVDNFRVLPGKGVEGYIDGRYIRLGSAAFVGSDGNGVNGVVNGDGTGASMRDMANSGDTRVYMSVDGIAVAVFSISDELRRESAATVSATSHGARRYTD